MLTLIFILIASNANIVPVLSAPISSRDANEETVHWVSGPNTRGTFELTLSCVLTLLLCMWTSLHLNIPPEGETAPQQFWRKFRWTLLALFAPELVLLCAWQQWAAARALSKKMNELIDQKSECDRPRNPWTITHSFFAGMGGFAFQVDNGQTGFIEPENGLSRIPLTADGVLFLSKFGSIPDISEREIIDKSKADGFAKTLVCVQAGWCLLQYIGRLAASLPVSLLELNTLGHALCALAIYLSWWHKPLDVKEPYVLPGDQNNSLFAYMWMQSKLSGSPWKDDGYIGGELGDLRWDPNAEGSEGELQADVVGDAMTITLSPGDCLFGHRLQAGWRTFKDQIYEERVWRWPFFYHMEIRRKPMSRTVTLSAVDIRRWRLASDAIRQHLRLHEESRNRKLLRAHASDWSTSGLVDDGSETPLVALLFVSTAYGGLHASGWNHFFSSWQEQLLWRISSLVVIAPGGFVCLAGLWDFIERHCHWLQDWHWPWVPKRLKSGMEWGFALALFLAFAAYCACRVFLVVEAFIGLRELPAGVYITPPWSQLLPHL